MEKYIEKFKKGQEYVNVINAATKDELTDTNDINEEYKKLDCIKFVPASGAASRMFKDLYQYLHKSNNNDFINDFFNNIEKFAFYDELSEIINKNNLDTHEEKDRKVILEYLLNTNMKYGKLPKALLKVHRENDCSITPIDEHIKEANAYLNKDNKRLHFTISREHQDVFTDYIQKFNEKNLEITYSYQKKETDTLAVNMDNTPFLLDNGQPLYRPGGHGALMENLNDIDADIIFIKNIDNVCHDDHIATTIESKQKLATIGYSIKQKINFYSKAIDDKKYDIDEIKEFIKSDLNIKLNTDLTYELAKEILDRPFRVCGVVKNQGEPGGGPFIVENDKYSDLQICEKAELDLEDKQVKNILDNSEFFNPVDLVCFVKNYKGDKYDLRKYVKEDRYFISHKSYEGRELKALELPGLWNGAMHNWNTVFVEVPLITFNPVKNVNDLLKKGHSKS